MVRKLVGKTFSDQFYDVSDHFWMVRKSHISSMAHGIHNHHVYFLDITRGCAVDKFRFYVTACTGDDANHTRKTLCDKAQLRGC